MKKFLSTILAVVMVLGSMATVAFADGETATGTIKVNDVEYPSISAAEAAAGVGGTINISGTIYLSSREGIETDGLKLVGDGTAVITTADNFSAASASNRKSVLNVTGEGVTIENITFDGGTYGSTLVPIADNPADETEFNVVRVNSGSATLKNVTIKNSNRTLLSIGTASTAADVDVDGLHCDGVMKSVKNGLTYADVNVVNGTLDIANSEINGMICTDKNTNFWEDNYEGTIGNKGGNHFTLNCKYKWLFVTVTNDVTSTVKHFVDLYEYYKTTDEDYTTEFKNSIADGSNDTAISNMVTWTVDNGDADLKEAFGNLLLDASKVSGISTDMANKLAGYAEDLGVTEG